MTTLPALTAADFTGPSHESAVVRLRVDGTLAVLIALAALVRLPGMFSAFWFDEIWSWSIARQVHSPVDLLLADVARIDNNHPLNTLWLWMCGPTAPVFVYRLPSLLAGVGSVWMAARIMAWRGRVESLVAALLVALSMPLVYYASEARGYALVVFFALMAIDALQTAMGVAKSHRPPDAFSLGGAGEVEAAQRKQRHAAMRFGFACVMGFLSHLTFLHVYVGLFVWSVVHLRRTGLRAIVRLHAVPVACAAMLYGFFAAHMVIGGAAPTSAAGTVAASLSLAIGGPAAGPGSMLVAAVAAVLLLASLIWLARRDDQWVLFAVAVVICPAVITLRELLGSAHPQPLMVRYFLVPAAGMLLCLSAAAGAAWSGGAGKRKLVTLLLIVFTGASLLQTAIAVRQGRGRYPQALRSIIAGSDGPAVVGTDNPLRTLPLLEFYNRDGSSVRLADGAPQFLIVNRTGGSDAAPTVWHDNQWYRLEGVYDGGGLSGWAWHVYRR